MSDPVLHLLAGPNGSGKSTFAHRVLLPRTRLPFINADEIAAARWPGAESGHAYEASQVAAAARVDAITERRSFVTETVFSHPSKVDLVRDAAAAGYLVHLHVMLVPEDVTLRRVHYRVDGGGHSVPEAKVRERYGRLWALVAQARALADRTTVYDNSRADRPFHVVARWERGALIGDAAWPSWAPADLRAPGEPG